MPADSLPYHPSTLARRVAAAVYDSLLLLALWVTATFPLILVYRGEAIPAGSWWYPIYLIAIAGIFHVWFWSHGGQTLGMRAWRLWVIDETGRLPTRRQAARRYVISIFAWASVIGLIWCMFEARGHALHDLLSRTRITHIPR